jgi:hypothetical protein
LLLPRAVILLSGYKQIEHLPQLDLAGRAGKVVEEAAL